jgi:cytochrome c5
MKNTMALCGVMLTFALVLPGAALAQDGEAIYKAACAMCHDGMNNSAYKGRSAGALTDTVIAGKGAMKPRAGKPELKDEEIRAAVTFLLSK